MSISLLSACTGNNGGQKKEQSGKPDNPLLQKSTLQYQAPRFDLIKDEHFKPAFDYALKEHDKEIEQIANNTEAPTFANTILAIEASGEDLGRATIIFGNLTGSNTNPVLQALEEEYAPVFSAHSDKLYLNSKIYQRIKAIDISKLQGEDKRLAEYYLQQFELAGANLDDEAKEKVKKLNQEMATLSTQYTNKLLVARKNGTVYFDTEAELDGLSKAEISAAKEKADNEGKAGKFAIGIINTTQQPPLMSMKNRAAREKLFRASWTRAEKGDEG
ncbi:MAG: dipeptidyl carboxypeptidase II, partial [Chitinophagaceae bacterium]|nr:dipeptidyl carboxypeptidase II [Chitinophagaceae bacterium]